ncbi:MAG: DUF4065 domain-containing protein [Candidatus Omnitrophota bacterium]|jgi:uncharacterized phage-associated protein|nr:MAG: DUF4065 domain-containing protein [Candidatus Omnitrophota bacterium]
MISARDVANYFLLLVDEDCGDCMTNLKLQKLLYYAQGFHLAIFDTPLFDEPVKAWQHGPVVESLYYEYKQHRANSITPPEGFDISIFNEKQKDLLDEISQVYGQFSAWKLRNMTHEEPPWKNTPQGDEISHESMKEYFKTQLLH